MDIIRFFRHPPEILDHIPYRQGGTTVHRFAKCLVGQKRFITYQTVPLIYLKDNLTGKFFLAVEVSTEAKQEDWRSSYQYKIKRWPFKSPVYTWSITTNKASGGEGIPVELYQILKDDAVKVLHSICQQILKIQQWPQDWKRSVFIPIPKESNAKECSNYHTIALISHTSKVMLKILQARLRQYVNFQMFKLVLEKAEEPEIKLRTSAGS